MEITHFERGSALISTNNNNIAVEIKCSQMEKELITTIAGSWPSLLSVLRQSSIHANPYTIRI